MSQSFSEWELIIIDDGSSDNTESIVKEYIAKDQRIVYLKNESNLGIQKSLNRGLKEAKGKYIARIDDDDEWVDKDKLRKQVEFLDTNIDYVLVGTGTMVIDESGKEIFRYLLPETDKEIRNKILSKNCFVHSSVVFRKDASLKFNGYTEEKEDTHIEDYDLWLKLGTVGKLVNLSIYGINYMARDGSISSIHKLEQLRKNITLIKKYKNRYPNYNKFIVWSYFRLFIYRLSCIFPSPFINKVIKFYKEF